MHTKLLTALIACHFAEPIITGSIDNIAAFDKVATGDQLMSLAMHLGATIERGVEDEINWYFIQPAGESYYYTVCNEIDDGDAWCTISIHSI